MQDTLNPAARLHISSFCSNLLTRYGLNHLTADTLPEYLQAELAARAAVRSPYCRGSFSVESWQGFADWLARELACGPADYIYCPFCESCDCTCPVEPRR